MRRKKKAIKRPYILDRARPIAATEVKNRFGIVLENVLHGEPAVITRHGEAKALIISVEGFSELGNRFDSDLNTLTDEFDRLLDRMQSNNARNSMQSAFEASPQELGRTALRATRRS